MSAGANKCLHQLENCQVTANVKSLRRDQSEYHAVQVAASDRREKTTTNQMLGHFRRAGVPAKRIVKEFSVSADAHVPIGECSATTREILRELMCCRNHIICYTFRTRTVCGCDCKLVSPVTICAKDIVTTLFSEPERVSKV